MKQRRSILKENGAAGPAKVFPENPNPAKLGEGDIFGGVLVPGRESVILTMFGRGGGRSPCLITAEGGFDFFLHFHVFHKKVTLTFKELPSYRSALSNWVPPPCIPFAQPLSRWLLKTVIQAFVPPSGTHVSALPPPPGWVGV